MTREHLLLSAAPYEFFPRLETLAWRATDLFTGQPVTDNYVTRPEFLYPSSQDGTTLTGGTMTIGSWSLQSFTSSIGNWAAWWADTPPYTEVKPRTKVDLNLFCNLHTASPAGRRMDEPTHGRPAQNVSNSDVNAYTIASEDYVRHHHFPFINTLPMDGPFHSNRLEIEARLLELVGTYDGPLPPQYSTELEFWKHRFGGSPLWAIEDYLTRDRSNFTQIPHTLEHFLEYSKVFHPQEYQVYSTQFAEAVSDTMRHDASNASLNESIGRRLQSERSRVVQWESFFRQPDYGNSRSSAFTGPSMVDCNDNVPEKHCCRVKKNFWISSQQAADLSDPQGDESYWWGYKSATGCRETCELYHGRTGKDTQCVPAQPECNDWTGIDSSAWKYSNLLMMDAYCLCGMKIGAIPIARKLSESEAWTWPDATSTATVDPVSGGHFKATDSVSHRRSTS